MARRPAVIDPRDTHNPETALVTDFNATTDVGLAPWQAAGAKLPDEIITATEVLERSGNNFKVKTVPAYACVGENQYVKALDQRMIVREDNNAVLGVVGKKYRVIQNETHIDCISPLVDNGFASYDTAGLVYGGQIGWVMLKLKTEITLPGNDRVMPYLMALWSHNGAFSTRFFPSPMRAFCANVLSSLIAGASNGINVRHTKSSEARMEEAKRVIETSQGFYTDFQARATKLMTTRMTDGQMINLTDYLFPSKEEEDGTVKVSTRTKNIREKVLDLFSNGAGHETANIRGTAWAGYNAVAEFTDHHRSTRVGAEKDEGESRFMSTMMGSGAQVKAKAINWIDKNVLLLNP
jgi:phage/plasmid-like protein (TIGR03299 family)